MHLLQATDTIPDFGWIGTAKVIGAIFLPLIGICVVLFSLFVFARRDPQGQTQRIKGFGFELEGSVLTLFVLIGLALSLAGIYLITRDYETKIEELSGLKTDLERAEADLERAQKDFEAGLRQARQVDVTALITLKNTGGGGVPRPEQLECKLLLHGAEPRKLGVGPGIQENQYRVVIDNLNQNTPIQLLSCRDSSTRRTWNQEDFNPLAPDYTLERQP